MPCTDRIETGDVDLSHGRASSTTRNVTKTDQLVNLNLRMLCWHVAKEDAPWNMEIHGQGMILSQFDGIAYCDL